MSNKFMQKKTFLNSKLNSLFILYVKLLHFYTSSCLNSYTQILIIYLHKFKTLYIDNYC